MNTFSNAILSAIRAELERQLVTWVPSVDPSRAYAVKIGPLQGNPDLDAAPINVEVYANDPDNPEQWMDEAVEWEIGGTAIWIRRFTLLFRALLVESGESLEESLAIASDLRDRIEQFLLTTNWGSIQSRHEEADFLGGLEGEVSQGGGPDAYDWAGKIRFEVITRRR